MARTATEPNVETFFVCPCDWRAPLSDTYASVLVLGIDGVRTTLDEIIASSTGAVANTSSYCMKCRRITPSFNTACSMQDNVIHWKKKHSYYVACTQFIGAWPKQTRGMRLRNRRKKLFPIDTGEA